MGILIGVMLNLYISFGSTAILTILILPIQERGISFHVLESSSISFINVLYSSQYISLSAPWLGLILGFFCFFFNYLFIYLFIYFNFWLCWVFISVSVRGLSLVVASGGHSSSRCAGLSLSRPLLLRSTGSTRAGSVVVAHGPTCSAACGIFPDQGSNPCPLHWQADSQPLRHQGSPLGIFNVILNRIFFTFSF